jgi:hypothetical protein
MEARLEHTPQKPLRCLAQETSILKLSAAKVMKMLKLLPYTATIVHALKPRGLANRINFCNSFLQSVHDSEADPQLTFNYPIMFLEFC